MILVSDSRGPLLLTAAGGGRGVVVSLDNRAASGVTGANADIDSNWFQ